VAGVSYPVLHVDVYQGRNNANVNIDARCRDLPTTMKAACNAILHTNLANDVSHGYRTVSMDNRYQCPELSVLLRDQWKILTTGTCRKHRKGWPKDLLVMDQKNSERGATTFAYDKVNKVLCMQWRDNKIVNCCSTIIDTSLKETSRRSGSSVLSLQVPRPLKHYHLYMNSVDKGDQARLQMGGFARKAHFKKWYKKVYLCVLDFGLLNAFVAWSFKASQPGSTINKMRRYEFYEWVYDDMLRYQAPSFSSTINDDNNIPIAIPQCYTATPDKAGARCIVCRLDSNYSRDNAGVKRLVVYCKNCKVYVHNHQLATGDTRKIHDRFGNLTCHEIYKSTTGKEIWKRSDGSKEKHVQRNHPVLEDLRETYGVAKKRTRKS
jgi:hypothetical protein